MARKRKMPRNVLLYFKCLKKHPKAYCKKKFLKR